ncbi:MAG: transposase [Leptolyngbya sp. DLM2.Bin15]|nr:MAG: transposase [Leptolyngbya sp. DLM2.Bin15]
MAPKKLSDADKQTIIELYRHPDESTSTLANRFGVSSSTISRIVKQGLPSAEYEDLVQQKRSGPRSVIQFELSPTVDLAPEVEPTPVPIPDPVPEPVAKPEIPRPRRVRPRLEPAVVSEPEEPQESQEDKEKPDKPVKERLILPNIRSSAPAPSVGRLDEDETSDRKVSADLDDDDDDDDDEDDLDDLDNADYSDDDEDDDEDDDDGGAFQGLSAGGDRFTPLEIRPLIEASLTRSYYVVVDRSANLITRPLKDFADLGQIDEAETRERTLPVFDNHRIARRFSRRTQRIVKVPDGKVLHKVSRYLNAKGITRLFVDGHIYEV